MRGLVTRWLERRIQREAAKRLQAIVAATKARQDTPHSLAARKGWAARRAQHG